MAIGLLGRLDLLGLLGLLVVLWTTRVLLGVYGSVESESGLVFRVMRVIRVAGVV